MSLGITIQPEPLEGPERRCLSVTGEHRLAYQQNGPTAMVSKRAGEKRGGRKA